MPNGRPIIGVQFVLLVTLCLILFSDASPSALISVVAAKPKKGTAKPPAPPETPSSAATESHGFEAEVSKMLDILIHSLYTNKAIFMRELISNANDALDKIRISSLTDPREAPNQFGVEPTMDIRVRQDGDQLIIRDGGIGMTREELAKNLGTLGRSGTKAFLEHLKSSATDSSNLIGQFGVGFYSAFLVAENVKVASKHDNSDKQYVWESKGDGSFIIYEDPRGNTLGRGTEVILTLKDDTDDFRNENLLRKEIFGYSAFVQYPIFLWESTPAPDDVTEDELDENGVYKTYVQVNDVAPVWFRPIGTVEPHEYAFYYKTTTGDYHEPLYWSHFKVEGAVDFTSLLYIPGEAERDDFSEDFNLKNIKLFVRRVFITDEFRDLLPRYLNFIKGIIDSDDLPLNVSREQLQESRTLLVIRRKLIRKALGMIAEVQEQDDHMSLNPDTGNWTNNFDVRPGNKRLEKPMYGKLWEEFGKHLRMGILEDATNRARIARLLRYRSSASEGALISLETYISRMKANQTGIYYISAESVERAERSPIVQDAVARGLEVLYFVDPIDDFIAVRAPEFAGRKLINLGAGGDADFHDGEKDERVKVLQELREARFAPLMKRLQKLFGEKDVGKVVLTKRLNAKDAFIVTSLDPSLTARMANIMRSQTMAQSSMIENPVRVLELNYRHPLVVDLLERFQVDPDDRVARDIAWTLYDAASVEAEFGMKDASAYFKRLNRVLRVAAQLAPNEELLPDDSEAYDVEAEIEARRAAAAEAEAAARASAEELNEEPEEEGGFRSDL